MLSKREEDSVVVPETVVSMSAWDTGSLDLSLRLEFSDGETMSIQLGARKSEADLALGALLPRRGRAAFHQLFGQFVGYRHRPRRAGIRDRDIDQLCIGRVGDFVVG